MYVKLCTMPIYLLFYCVKVIGLCKICNSTATDAEKSSGLGWAMFKRNLVLDPHNDNIVRIQTDIILKPIS